MERINILGSGKITLVVLIIYLFIARGELLSEDLIVFFANLLISTSESN